MPEGRGSSVTRNRQCSGWLPLAFTQSVVSTRKVAERWLASAAQACSAADAEGEEDAGVEGTGGGAAVIAGRIANSVLPIRQRRATREIRFIFYPWALMTT